MELGQGASRILARPGSRSFGVLWPPASAWRAFRQQLVGAIATAVEKRRLFVLLPFGLILGLVCYAILPGEPPSIAHYAGGFVTASVLFIAIWQRSMDGLRIAIQGMAVWLGFCLLPLHGLAFGTAMLDFPTYGTYEAHIDEVLSADATQQRVIVSGVTPVTSAKPVDIRRARLVLPADIALRPGDMIRAALRLAPIPGPVLPGAHDGQFQSYFVGVGAYGSVTGDLERIARHETFSLGRQIRTLRNAIGQRIDTVLIGDTAAIGKAMVVGDQSAITDQTRDTMAAAGLAHIYSISGLHLSIVAGGIFWLVRLALASSSALVAWPVKQIAALPASLRPSSICCWLAASTMCPPSARP